jgi:tetratricopeptide (TPR) repeat protein
MRWRTVVLISCVSLSLVQLSLADDNFERAWGRCSQQLPASPDQRVKACGVVLAVGPSGGGNHILPDGRTRGELLFWGAYYARGQAYLLVPQYSKAIVDFTIFINHVSEDEGVLPIAYGNRGFSFYNLGEYDKAIADLDAAEAVLKKHQLGPDKPGSMANLRGDIEMIQKNFGSALRHFQEFHDLYPNTPGLTEKISLARQLKENPQSSPPVIPRPAAPTPSEACKMYPNLC